MDVEVKSAVYPGTIVYCALDSTYAQDQQNGANDGVAIHLGPAFVQAQQAQG